MTDDAAISGIFNAFAAAKSLHVKRLEDAPAAGLSGADLTYKRVMGLIGDPLPHGVEPNRPVIEKLIAHAVSQRILDEPPPLETLFHPSTLDLTG